MNEYKTTKISENVRRSLHHSTGNGDCVYLALACATDTPYTRVERMLNTVKGRLPNFDYYYQRRTYGTRSDTIRLYFNGLKRRGEAKEVRHWEYKKGQQETLRKFVAHTSQDKRYIICIGTGSRAHAVALVDGRVFCNGREWDIEDYPRKHSRVQHSTSFKRV